MAYVSDVNQQRRTIPCGRTWDHEPHEWLSEPGIDCPGEIATPIGQAAMTVEKKIVPQCSARHQGRQCVLPEDHGGTEHKAGTLTWPMHLPFEQQKGEIEKWKTRALKAEGDLQHLRSAVRTLLDQIEELVEGEQ